MLDIHWTLTVNVPEIALWGEKIVGELTGIKDAMAQLVAQQTALTQQQSAGFAALATQLTAIADEIAQAGGSATTEQLAAVEQAIRDAAKVAEDQVASAQEGVAQLEANTQQIMQIIPDAPTP